MNLSFGGGGEEAGVTPNYIQHIFTNYLVGGGPLTVSIDKSWEEEEELYTLCTFLSKITLIDQSTESRLSGEKLSG